MADLHKLRLPIALSQLRAKLTKWLNGAEPLTRPSKLEDSTGVAVKASVEVGLLGCGVGDLYRTALAVSTPKECAAFLIYCLAAIPKEDTAEESGNRELLTIKETAEGLGVSDRMVYRLVQRGELLSYRESKCILIKPAALKRYFENGQTWP